MERIIRFQGLRVKRMEHLSKVTGFREGIMLGLGWLKALFQRSPWEINALRIHLAPEMND
jgi:hypothetical protein